MANLRTRNRLFSFKPPPSPIANAKGSRSAAVDDRILSEYLEKTLEVPDLILPESYFPASTSRRVPAEIDLTSILLRNDDSTRQLLESARELGLFRLIGHGISGDELQSIVAEAECLFQISEEKKRDLYGNFGLKIFNREEFFCFRSGKEMLREEIGSEIYQTLLSEKMENMYSRLEAVADSVGEIFSECMRKSHKKRIEERESILRFKRHNHNILDDRTSTCDDQEEINMDSFDPHALSLYLFDGDHKLYVQSQKGYLSFNISSSTIVVIIRKQLEEWSHGEFKCISEEPIVDNGSFSYSIEFMCSPATLKHDLNQIKKTISILDQIIILLAVILLYNFFVYISS